jgi:hypothetical protein
LVELDVSHNVSLNYLYCSANSLTSLELNTELNKLWCDNNKLIELNLIQNPNLTELNCSKNQLTKLDISKNKNLIKLNCKENQLTELDVSKNSMLDELNYDDNQFSAFDASKKKELKSTGSKKNKLKKGMKKIRGIEDLIKPKRYRAGDLAEEMINLGVPGSWEVKQNVYNLIKGRVAPRDPYVYIVLAKLLEVDVETILLRYTNVDKSKMKK